MRLYHYTCLDYLVKAYIYVLKEGYYTSKPLVINNTFYWNSILGNKSNLLNYIFTLKTKPTYNLSLNKYTIECLSGGNYSLELLAASIRSYNKIVSLDTIGVPGIDIDPRKIPCKKHQIM